MREASASLVLKSGCVLGEGPFWDQVAQALLFVDIKRNEIWTWAADGGLSSRTMHDTVGFAIPCDDGGVIAGVGMSLVHTRPGDEPVTLAVIEGSTETRINDGTIAPDGTIWFGTMDRAEERPRGDFWSYHPKWGLKRHDVGWAVTNGPAISPDGGTMYLAHSNERVVYRAAIKDGAVGELLEFVRFPTRWGYPDGMAVDVEGNLWIAHWGGGRVTRFDAGGSADFVVRVPTLQPTKCAFGAADRATMFITSASIGLQEPLAGHLFGVPVDVPGPALPRFVVQRSFTPEGAVGTIADGARGV